MLLMQPNQIITPGGPVQTPQQDEQRAQAFSVPEAAQSPNHSPLDEQSMQDDMAPSVGVVEWSASEFTHNEKSTKWYVSLAGIALVAASLIFLLTRDFITVGAILLVAFAFGFVANRRPRTLQYSIDESGVMISGKHYPFQLFKSFSVIDEGQASSINLLPVKRFMPMVSMYYPIEREEEIANILGEYLPYEHRQSAMVDDVMRRFRF